MGDVIEGFGLFAVERRPIGRLGPLLAVNEIRLLSRSFGDRKDRAETTGQAVLFRTLGRPAELRSDGR